MEAAFPALLAFFRVIIFTKFKSKVFKQNKAFVDACAIYVWKTPLNLLCSACLFVIQTELL